MMPEGVAGYGLRVTGYALNVGILPVMVAVFFLKEFWHKKKSYFLVGNRDWAYKTCCTAQKQ
jgi:hypothetical protein